MLLLTRYVAGHLYYVISLWEYKEQFTVNIVLFIYYFVYIEFSSANDYLILTEFGPFSPTSFSCIFNFNVL
jgi:hypothetical protein